MSARTDLQITWHPGYSFGEPCIGGTAIKAEAVASLIWAGDDVAEVAEDYGLTVEQARLACWWWWRHADGATDTRRTAEPCRRVDAWNRWADAWLSWAGGHLSVDPGDPPGVTQ